MEALWLAGEASVREVHNRVYDRTHWKFTTTQTVLHRLVYKRNAEVTRRRQTAYFRPAIPRHRARWEAVMRFCEMAFGGNANDLAEFLLENIIVSRGARARVRDVLDALDGA